VKQLLIPASLFTVFLMVSTVLALDLDKELNSTKNPSAEEELSSVKQRGNRDVLDELESVKSHRKKKEIEQTKAARQQEQSRMANACKCVLESCFHLDVIYKKDPKTGEMREVRPTKAQRNARARAEAEKKKICKAWEKNKDQDEASFLASIAQLEQELGTELAAERQLSEERKLKKDAEARAYTEKLRNSEQAKKQKDAAAKADADARAADRESEKREWCRAEITKGIYHCGCGKYDPRLGQNWCAK